MTIAEDAGLRAVERERRPFLRNRCGSAARWFGPADPASPSVGDRGDPPRVQASVSCRLTPSRQSRRA